MAYSVEQHNTNIVSSEQMKCTSCEQGQGLLEAALLDDLFPCFTCNHCQGNLVFLDDYLNWLEHNSTVEWVADTTTIIEAQETKNAMLCPKNGRLMLKYRISKNTDHRLDLCPNCHGIWLDKGEWELLKQESLAGKLNTIFTNPWQKKIRKGETKHMFIHMYEHKFGNDAYDELKRIKGWLNHQDKKREMIAYLLCEDPYTIS